MDRRVARTRNALHEALMSLILRKGYDAVTIQDILDEADVGRSTFYSHFAGKDELMRDGFRRLRADLGAAQAAARARNRGAGITLSFSLTLFEHAEGYKRVYRALVGGKGSTIVLKEIRRVLADLVKKETGVGAARGVPAELRVRFIVDALLTVLTWWLEKEPGLRPSRVDALFQRLVVSGIRPS